MLTACALCLFAAGGLEACGKTEPARGGLMLVVSRDGPLALGRLGIEVRSKGVSLLSNKYRVPEEVQLPTTVAIVSNGDATQRAEISVTGWQVSGQPGVPDVPLDRRDQIVTQIPTDRVATLAVVLSARCSDKLMVDDRGEAVSSCGPGNTCDNFGNCGPSTVVASDLPSFHAGDENAIPGNGGASTVGGVGGSNSVSLGGTSGSSGGTAGRVIETPDDSADGGSSGAGNAMESAGASNAGASAGGTSAKGGADGAGAKGGAGSGGASGVGGAAGAHAAGASVGGATGGGGAGGGGAGGMTSVGMLSSPPWQDVPVQDSSNPANPIPLACNTVTKIDADGQGPFFIHELERNDDISLNRQDARGQYNASAEKGVDMELYVRLVDKTKSDAACGMIVPVPGVEVYIWHADAQGYQSGFGMKGAADEQRPDVRYSGTPGTMNLETSDRFCRAIQTTDSDGVASFLTTFPGWYNGRDLHINIASFKKGSMSHARVTYSKSIEPAWIFTSQFYFDPTFSRSIHEAVEPYKRRTALSAYIDAMTPDEPGYSARHATAVKVSNKVVAQIQIVVDPT